MKLTAICADITTLEVDVIVNAANQFLMGGSGVDGAIHRAAGPDLLAVLRLLGGCAIGDAKMTKGYNLPTKFVIHTVGPRWSRGDKGEPELLASCYRRSVELADSVGATSIAFPSISTGVFRFPVDKAAVIAVQTVKECVTESSPLKEIIFCCFSEIDLDVYNAVIKNSFSSPEA
jgi:O-acetyl-ADP-ribose deacetylase (regulator of RNase III)